MNGANLQSLDKIKALRSNYNKYQSIMTQYEQQTITEEINRTSEAIFPSVATAAIGDWNAAIAKAQESVNKVNVAKVAESNRFNPAQLAAEYSIAKTKFDLAQKEAMRSNALGGQSDLGQKQDAIYSEAMKSGDIHKMRAVGEVALGEGYHPTQVHADLESLRVTPEMQQAEADRNQAFTALQAQRQELIEVSQALGQQDPTLAFASGSFARALKMVQVKDGEVKFYPADSPEVTGNFRKPELEKIG
jgi:hypothetical protein